MKFYQKYQYIFTLLLCLVAGFSVYGQGTIVWEKPLTKIWSDQTLKTAVQSRDKQFWVSAGDDVFLRPNQTILDIVSAVAFNATTGDTLWYKKLSVGYAIDSRTWGVANAPNGHFWVVTQYVWDNSTPAYGAGIAVFELDSLGNVLQQKEFMQGCNSFSNFAVYSQPDGGLIIVGHILRKVPDCSEWDLFALRIDGQGFEIWQSIYALPYNQSILSAGLYPGNKLCIGYYDGNTSFQNRMLFIDINSGQLLYQKNTPSNDPQKAYLSCQPMRDGSFMISGGNGGVIPLKGYIARTDANFNTIWERFDNTAVAYYNTMKETRDSAVIVTGKRSTTNRQPFMAKIRLSDGVELWRQDFKLPDNGMSSINFEIGHDGDVYEMGGIVIPNVTQARDFYVARYTGVADFLQPSDYCSDSVRANFTGTWLQDTLRLHSTSNSGMAYQDSLDYQWLINGATVSLDSAFQQFKSSADYPQGLPVSLVITNFWGCKDTLTARVTPQGIVGNKPNIGGGAYLQNPRPNPSTQNVTIGYTLPANTKEAVLRVYELGTGRTVAERQLSALEPDTKLNVSHWATGVYAYQLFINGAPVAVKQLVVTR